MTTLEFTVTSADTARALGSGDLEVLGTPRLIAWCEAATCAAIETNTGPNTGQTSVGTRVDIQHLAASPVGATITVAAEVSYRDGRLVRFEVRATDGNGTLVGSGQIQRVIVDRERFLARLPAVGK